MLEELRNNRQTAFSVNEQNAQGMDIVVHQQASRNNNGFIPLSVDHHATASMDQMEAGRR